MNELQGQLDIFGGALLLGNHAAAERAAAERWTLSDREKAIAKHLDVWRDY